MLEYCAKGSLLNIYSNQMTVEDKEWHREVHGYFLQMIEAISFSISIPYEVHESGVIHRDIKP